MANPMKLIPKVASVLRNLWFASLLFAVILSGALRANSQDGMRARPQAGATNSLAEASSTSVTGEQPPELEYPLEITRFDTEFDGDHSLDVATVVEQASSGTSRYLVRLQLASGTEQLITMTAPPGGLRLEMRDMTGDNVPNDVVLIPRLLRWPPTILVNEGHDHFEVAITGPFPGSLGSGEGRASRSLPFQEEAVLVPSFHAGAWLSHRRLFALRFRQMQIFQTDQPPAMRFSCGANSGRAPPFFSATQVS